MSHKFQLSIDEHVLSYIFRSESSASGRICGFHHDPFGFMRAKGTLRIITMFANECYIAEIWHNDEWIQKYCFPEAMSFEDIMNLLMEACAVKDTRFVEIIQGERKRIQIKARGITIEAICDQHGKILTFYPKL